MFSYARIDISFQNNPNLLFASSVITFSFFKRKEIGMYVIKFISHRPIKVRKQKFFSELKF